MLVFKNRLAINTETFLHSFTVRALIKPSTQLRSKNETATVFQNKWGQWQFSFQPQLCFSTSVKSIYDEETDKCVGFQKEDIQNENKKKQKKREQNLSGSSFFSLPSCSFLQYGNKYVSMRIRRSVFLNTMEELHHFFENTINELKNYEYVYFFFKIYEILYVHIYRWYKSSPVFHLNNPNFEVVSFSQYVRKYWKREVRKQIKSSKVFKVTHEKEEIEISTDTSLDNANIRNIEWHETNMHEISTNALTELYFQYITNLKDINIKNEEWKKCAHTFFTKANVEFFNKTLQIACKKISSFSCFEIINFLYIVKKINVCSIKDVYSIAQHLVLQNMKYVGEEELIKIGGVFLNNSNKKKNIMNIFKNNNNNKNFIETYLQFLLHNIKNMNNDKFVKVLEYVSNNNYKHIHFFKECKNEIYRRMNNFTLQQKIQLFYLYSQNVNASDKLLMSTFIEEITLLIKTPNINAAHSDSDTVEEKRPNRDYVEQMSIPLSVWLNGIWANAKYFKEYLILLKGSESLILTNISHLDVASVSMIIWAYSTVETKNCSITFDHTVYVELKRRALQLYKRMTPKQLSNALLGLAITLGRTITGEGAIDTSFHCEVEKYLLEQQFPLEKKHKNKNVQETNTLNQPVEREEKKKKEKRLIHFFTAEDLTNTCYAYCIVRSGSKELHGLLQNALVSKTADLSPQQITKLVYTYGNLYMHKSYTLLNLLQYEILQRMHQFRYNEICDILWSYCVNKYYDPNYWKTLLYIIDFEKVYSDERCSLLYSCLSFINLIDPCILDSYNVLRIFKMLREQYWCYQTTEFPHSFAEEVIEVIKEENRLLERQNKEAEIKNAEEAEKETPYEEKRYVKKNDTEENDKTKTPLCRFECIQKMFDFEGLLIDIYAEYNNKKYAFFLHNALNTMTDGTPLGESILKSRFFKKKKIHQVHLLYSIWKNQKKRKIDLIYAQI